MPLTDKIKRKHKKEKHKKHKKEKKSKKHKKQSHKRKSYSSDSDSSSVSEKQFTEEDRIKEDAKHSELNFLDAVLSDSNTMKRKKMEKNVSSNLSEKPGQSVRELNPYWKDGGCGLPPNISEKSEDLKCSFKSSNYQFNESKDENNAFKSKFLKPGEGINLKTAKNSYQGNWKRKNILEEDSHSKTETTEESLNKPVNVSKIYTNDELNSLAAKLVKAEIMGNTVLIEKLKAELETAKKMRKQETQINPEEKVIVTQKSITKPCEDTCSYNKSKKQKLETHIAKERVCYFPDDDKYSLKNLFEKEKAGDKEDPLLITAKLKGRSMEDFDDAYLEAAASKKLHDKNEERMSQRSIKEAIGRHKALEACHWCLDNKSKAKHLIVSTGNKSYLCVPEEESLTEGHCLIVPLQHETSTLHLDEEVWDEIKTYQKTLTKMFLEIGKDVVFFENARSFRYFPHCYIQCVPLDKEFGEVAPIYFQKAISESESEWSTNKKLIDFRNKDLRRSIPKGLPYFAVSFGNEGGFAHVIEDEHLFRRNFAEEVLGGMMDLDSRKWRKPRKESFRCQREKALEFLKTWKKFEFNQNSVDSDTSNSE